MTASSPEDAASSAVEAGAELESVLADGAAAAPVAGVSDPAAQLSLMRRVLERGALVSRLHPNGADSRRNALIMRRSAPEAKRLAQQVCLYAISRGRAHTRARPVPRA